jgi:hypothetical protein
MDPGSSSLDVAKILDHSRLQTTKAEKVDLGAILDTIWVLDNTKLFTR